MKKWSQRIVLGILLLVLVIVISILGYKKLHSSNKQEGDTIVKKNVKVITNKSDNQPESVEEDNIVFNSNPNYKEGDIIVSGITHLSEDGYIRKVISVEKKRGRYTIYTEPAVLTDVFEKAHIYKRIALTEDENQSVSYNIENKNAVSNILCDTEEEDDETDYMFGKSFEDELGPISLSGEAGVNAWIEVEIDIEHGEIECGITARTEEGAKASVECSQSYTKELEKQLSKKKLPNYQFLVAGIPIVVTNELEIFANAEMSLEGNIGASYELTSETTQGFRYSSKTGKVKEINEMDCSSDGLQWDTISISGEASAGPSVHLITKLYGASGLDMSLGISGDVEGEAKVSTNKELDGYAGSLDLSINPVIEGTLVVDTPIFDKNLVQQPLFVKELKPLWSKHWESSANWQEDLQWTEADEIEEAKEQVDTSYSNEYFDVQVPESWEGDWAVIEEDNSMNGIMSMVYHFTYNPEGENNGGASDVYVIDMSDASRPMGHYNRMIPDYCDFVGVTSFGAFNVFKMEVAAGFFHDGGATITLK